MTSTLNNSDDKMPANIMLEKWADIGFNWQGLVKIAGFERLAGVLDMPKQQVANDAMSVTVTLTKKNGILWLKYDIKAHLWIACQRCLSPMMVDVSDEYELAILQDDRQIGQIDDAEFVLIDEICPHAGRKMLPLKDLLEDELLLVLPLAPRHDDCQMPVEATTTAATDDNMESPFAALAALKGKL